VLVNFQRAATGLPVLAIRHPLRWGTVSAAAGT